MHRRPQLSALNTLHALLVVCDHQPLRPSSPTHRARCPARGKHMPHNYVYRHSKLHKSNITITDYVCGQDLYQMYSKTQDKL